jgi:hypothetical protein
MGDSKMATNAVPLRTASWACGGGVDGIVEVPHRQQHSDGSDSRRTVTAGVVSLVDIVTEPRLVRSALSCVCGLLRLVGTTPRSMAAASALGLVMPLRLRDRERLWMELVGIGESSGQRYADGEADD